jgi:hypothetical protein
MRPRPCTFPAVPNVGPAVRRIVRDATGRIAAVVDEAFVA